MRSGPFYMDTLILWEWLNLNLRYRKPMLAFLLRYSYQCVHLCRLSKHAIVFLMKFPKSLICHNFCFFYWRNKNGSKMDDFKMASMVKFSPSHLLMLHKQGVISPTNPIILRRININRSPCRIPSVVTNL